MTRTYTYRDAGLHSTPLRLFNRAASTLGWDGPAFTPDAVLEAAAKQAGLDDFGDDTYREPLEVLAHSVANEARLSAFGRASKNVTSTSSDISTR